MSYIREWLPKHWKIIVLFGVLSGFLFSFAMMISITQGLIFNYEFKADAIYLHSFESATASREKITLPHVREGGLDGVQVTLDDSLNRININAGNIKGYTHISGQIIVGNYEQYDQSINIGFEEKDEYGQTVFVPIVEHWVFTNQQVVDFDVPLKSRKNLELVIYGNDDGEISTSGFTPYLPGTDPPAYYVELILNQVILSKDDAMPSENTHSIDKMPLKFFGSKTSNNSNHPLDERALSTSIKPTNIRIKVDTEGYLQYYKETVPDMTITLPEEIEYVEIEGLESDYVYEFVPGRILLSNIKPEHDQVARIYIPQGAVLSNGYETKDDYIITQYVQRKSGFQALFDHLKKNQTLVILVIVVILTLLLGRQVFNNTSMEAEVVLFSTLALIIGVILMMISFMIFNVTNGKLFFDSTQSIFMMSSTFFLLGVAFSICTSLLIFSVIQKEFFFICLLISLILLLLGIALVIITMALSVMYIAGLCIAFFVLIMLGPLFD